MLLGKLHRFRPSNANQASCRAGFAVSSNIKAAKAARTEAAKREEKNAVSSGKGNENIEKKAGLVSKPKAVYGETSRRHSVRVSRGELEYLKSSSPQNIHEALSKLRGAVWAQFDETVELAVSLNLDPRKPNQSIKGVARLPHGVGRVVRVGVFASAEDAVAAIKAGADYVGAEDFLLRIQGGDVPFDTIISTPDMMPMVSKIGKILGPRGLMPNPKMGTVTNDLTRAVATAKAGAVQFRVEKKGIVHAGIGKLSFSNEALLENIRSFMIAVADAKPEGLKGVYISKVFLSSTMGPGILVELPSVDPNSAKFLKTVTELKS